MQYFLEPITKHYADFQGRATRTQYWLFFLIAFAINIVLSILEAFLFGSGLLSGLFFLAILVPSLALTARRLHDMGQSGWWQLLMLIPFLGALAILVMCCLPSQPDNRYGSQPEPQVA